MLMVDISKTYRTGICKFHHWIYHDNISYKIKHTFRGVGGYDSKLPPLNMSLTGKVNILN